VTVGFVGLGEMGLPMAANLVASGRDVVGFDTDASALARAKEAGVRGGDVSESDVAVVMVRTLEQVEAAVNGLDGPRIVVVMSTVDPGGIERVAGSASVPVLDAPVSGGVRGAEARTLSIMVSGDRAAFEEVRPLLDELGSTVRYLGERPGLGQTAKLANQLMMTVALAGTLEGLALAERYGLGDEAVLEVVGAGTGSSWVLEHWDWMRSLWEGYEPGNALDVLLKDMRALFRETEAQGHASPVAEAAYARLLAHWQPFIS
jgi:3-hydroxyisobutyrate dehydrogenase-like beta-hydroxyacid dehydrogenase